MKKTQQQSAGTILTTVNGSGIFSAKVIPILDSDGARHRLQRGMSEARLAPDAVKQITYSRAAGDCVRTMFYLADALNAR